MIDLARLVPSPAERLPVVQKLLRVLTQQMMPSQIFTMLHTIEGREIEHAVYSGVSPDTGVGAPFLNTMPSVKAIHRIYALLDTAVPSQVDRERMLSALLIAGSKGLSRAQEWGFLLSTEVRILLQRTANLPAPAAA